jgi:hypothetical protein
MREKYNLLYLQRPYFIQRALRKHLEDNILPGIALYQVLKDDLGDQTAALTYLDELFAAKMATSNERKQLMWLKYLPDPFAMLRKASQNVGFERSMTHGRGDPVCNFRYVRVKPNGI